MTANEDYIRRNKVVIVDDDKNTKLHYAAAMDNVDVIQKIIISGQKLDSENYLGWTPLMMAVKNGNSASVDLLLDAGANAMKKNKFGMNVFLISITCGVLTIVDKILNHLLCGGISRRSLQREFSPVSMSLLFQQDHIFKYLLGRSFDPNAATTFTGITPIMFAAALEDHKAINRLLQSKADPGIKNHLGKTAMDILHLSSQLKRRKIDIESNSGKRKPQVPVIIVSPHDQNAPQLQLTPYPTTAMQGPMRSSNTLTPNTPSTPAVSPITPQMFFGPDFTPTNPFVFPVFASPFNGGQVFNLTYTICSGGNNTSSSSILNTAINPVFPSPVFPQAVVYPSSA